LTNGSKNGKGSCIKKPIGYATGIILIIVAFLPLFFLIRDFFKPEDFLLIKDPKFLRVLWFSLYQAFLSSVLAFFVAILPALYCAKNNNPISSLLENAIFIPFFFPPVSMVIAFSTIFSSSGILAGLGFNPNILYTLKAILIAHVFYNSPIFVKYISHSLMTIQPEVFDASRLEGINRFKTLLKIEFPLILPSIFKAFFLVFTYSFMSFAVVLNLGGIRYSTIEVSIANALRGSFDFSQALFYALVQFVILFILNFILSHALKDNYEMAPPQKLKAKTSVFEKIVAWLYCLFEYTIIIIGLSGICFNHHEGTFTLKPLFNLFSRELNRKFKIITSILNSIVVAFIASTVSTLIGYWLTDLKTKLTDYFILPMLGVSSAFIGMSLLYTNILYHVPFPILICFGFIFITVPLAYSFLYQSVKGFEAELTEAAFIDGANRLKAFIYVKFPILLPAILAVFFQIFAIIYGEFTISYTMQIRDFFPLASVVNYSLSAHRYYMESQAFASLNTIIVFTTFFTASLFTKKLTKN
jgi:thiamine transport system permease protein